MINTEGLSIRGRVAYRIRDAKDRKWSFRQNLITTVGKEYFIDRILGNTSNIITQIQIGGNDTTPAESDTNLYETNPISKDILFRYKNPSFSNQIILASSFLDTESDTPSNFDNGNNEIKEVGLFNSSSQMIARTTLSGNFIKSNTDIFDVVWTITIG